MGTNFWGSPASSAEAQNCERSHGIDFEYDWPLGIADYRYVVPVTVLMASIRQLRIPRVPNGSLRFLCLLAAFDNTPIPDFFWSPSPRFRDPVLRACFKNKESFAELIDPLEKAGLIRHSRDRQIITLHRSLQIVLRGILSGVVSDSDGLPEFTQKECSSLYWATRVVEVTSVAYNEHPKEEGYFSELLLLQVTWCIRLGRRFPIVTEELSELQINFGREIRAWGLVTEAWQMYKDALSIQEKSFGKSNEKLVDTLRCLGSLSQISGNYFQALGFFERALRILGGPYGAFNPSMVNRTSDAAGQYDRLAMLKNILESIEGVAEMCRDRGRLESALAIYVRILELKSLCTRENHVGSADTFHDIGVTLHLMGKHEDALIGLQKALNVYQNERPDEIRVATAMHNIGMLYVEMGTHEEGFKFLRQSLEIGQPYSKPSIDLAMKIGNIAVVFARLGRSAEAMQWARSALAMFQEFPSDLTRVPAAQILHNIGLIEMAFGKRKLARKSLRLSIRILKNTIGGHHYKTRRAKGLLKTFTPRSARHRRLRSERCDRADEQAFGGDHIASGDTINDLGNAPGSEDKL